MARAFPTGPTPGSDADRQPDADPEQVARTILLRRLNAAPRSRSELEGDLRTRGVPDDVAERVLDRFTEVGLINDETFARMWVESRQRSRGMARPVLRQELRRKGIDVEVAEAALEEIDADDERTRAVELARVKARSLRRLEPQARVRRLVGMLQRRGYSGSVAFSVVREVLDDLPEEWDAPSE